jgi:sugar-specific transcriptional regulator TrmB
MEPTPNDLEEFGLTPAEAKVYLALLQTGRTTAGPLLDRTSLQNSTLHKTLHRLIDKGFASFSVLGKHRNYVAADPLAVLNIIENRTARFKELLPKLSTLQQPIDHQEATVYEGFNGLKTMLYEFIKDSQKGDEYLFFAFYTENTDDFDNVYTFYREFEQERKRRGIVVKGIAPTTIIDKFQGRDTTQIAFVDYPVPMNIGVFRDAVILTPWEDGQVSYLIRSRQLAESFRRYFYSVWKPQSRRAHRANSKK